MSGTPAASTELDAQADYFRLLRKCIIKNWTPPRDAPSASVRFTIDKTGSLRKVHLSRSTGSRIGDDAALNAITTPMPAPPPGEQEERTFEVTFDADLYNQGTDSIIQLSPQLHSGSQLYDKGLDLASGGQLPRARTYFGLAWSHDAKSVLTAAEKFTQEHKVAHPRDPRNAELKAIYETIKADPLDRASQLALDNLILRMIDFPFEKSQ